MEEGDATEIETEKVLQMERVDISPHLLRVSVDEVLGGRVDKRAPAGQGVGVVMGWSSFPEGEEIYPRAGGGADAEAAVGVARGPLAAWHQARTAPLGIETFMREAEIPGYAFPERALAVAMASRDTTWTRQHRYFYQQKEPPDPEPIAKGGRAGGGEGGGGGGEVTSMED